MAVDTKLIRDLVIVVPGIMGSALVGRDGESLWDVRPGSLASAVRSLARGRLTLPGDVGPGPARDGVRAVRLLDSLHVIPGLWSPVTGYDTLLDFLRGPRFQFIEPDPAEPGRIPNLLSFPYDWRLSCRYNGAQLAALALPALERWREQPGMQDARLVLICHSMGGLVARWFAAFEGGAGHIRALVTLGTPERGAARALGALVNGLEASLGLLREPLTGLARSLPALHELLPQYRCFVDADGQRQRLDPATCAGVDPFLWDSASDFHRRLAACPVHDPIRRVVGIRQPTLTTAFIEGDRLVLAETIDGQDDGGDGTVPRLATEPEGSAGALDVVTVAEQHGELQGRRAVWDLLDGLLTQHQVIRQGASAAAPGLGVRMADVWSTVESPTLQVDPRPDEVVVVEVLDEAGSVVRPATMVPRSGRVTLAPLPEGAWRVRVRGRFESPQPVTKPLLVMDAA